MVAHEPRIVAEKPGMRQAAVAVILRETSEHRPGSEVLFIRRAEKKADPWSGQMAFPGGHREPDDPSLQHAAMRETLEEIGLDLNAHADYLGALDQEHAVGRGRPMNMLIAPHVFQLNPEPASRSNFDSDVLTLNHEVAEVVWTPLAPILSAEAHTQEECWINGTPTPFGGYRISGDHFVWGLTYRMLHSLCRVLDENWRQP